jgi:hypothetical protein
MTSGVRLTSGLTRTVFFILFYGGSPFLFGEKNEKKNTFSYEIRATQAAEAQYMPTVHHWWDAQ